MSESMWPWLTFVLCSPSLSLFLLSAVCEAGVCLAAEFVRMSYFIWLLSVYECFFDCPFSHVFKVAIYASIALERHLIKLPELAPQCVLRALCCFTSHHKLLHKF